MTPSSRWSRDEWNDDRGLGVEPHAAHRGRPCVLRHVRDERGLAMFGRPADHSLAKTQPPLAHLAFVRRRVIPFVPGHRGDPEALLGLVPEVDRGGVGGRHPPERCDDRLEGRVEIEIGGLSRDLVHGLELGDVVAARGVLAGMDEGERHEAGECREQALVLHREGVGPRALDREDTEDRALRDDRNADLGSAVRDDGGCTAGPS